MRKLFLLAALLLAFAIPSFGQILWMGGEDIDFPNGYPIYAYTGGGGTGWRTGYARESVVSAFSCEGLVASYKNPSISTPFPGGAVNTAWLHFQEFDAGGTQPLVSSLFVGVGTQATPQSTLNAIWLGSDSSSAAKTAVWSSTASSATELASESGTSLSGSVQQFDMQITYGSPGSIYVYLNGSGSPLISYTGTVEPGGNTTFNSIFIGGKINNCTQGASEIIVSSTDSRAMSLVTLVPGGAGATNTFTSGTYSNINPTAINNASIANSQTSSQIIQTTMNSLPSGSFAISGIKVAARSVKGSTGIASLSPGVYTHSTVEVPSATGLNPFWFPLETYYATNPYTSAAFTPSEINALQLALESAP